MSGFNQVDHTTEVLGRLGPRHLTVSSLSGSMTDSNRPTPLNPENITGMFESWPTRLGRFDGSGGLRTLPVGCGRVRRTGDGGWTSRPLWGWSAPVQLEVAMANWLPMWSPNTSWNR